MTMAGKSIVMTGLGAIGSHLALHLARTPDVGCVTLVDRENYEIHNVLSANQDILPNDVDRPKVEVQARRMRAIRPDLEIIAVHAALETLPLAVWRADLIIAGLDSRGGRQAVHTRAWHLGVPLLDTGVLASEWLARVNIYVPGEDAPCLECAWSERDYELLEQEYPCGGPAHSPAHTGGPSALGSLAAAMAALESRKVLFGDPGRTAIGLQVMANARWHQYTETSFRRNPQCRFDHAVWPIEPLRCRLEDMCLRDLLDLGGGSASVPLQRFVRRRLCRDCGRAETQFHLEASLDSQCSCGGAMKAPGFDIVETLNGQLPPQVLRMSLAEAGLRNGDVLKTANRYLEISAGGVIASGK
jgi:molybdopterin/thiamine biosynthesis adenylyltransferase